MTEIADPNVAAVYALPGRSTRAIVDLDAIAGNVTTLRHLLPASTSMMAVVKANGYGHGAVMVSRCALASGVTMLGVATVGEAAELLDHQITAPILLLGPCDVSEVRRAVSLGIEITVAGPELLTQSMPPQVRWAGWLESTSRSTPVCTGTARLQPMCWHWSTAWPARTCRTSRRLDPLRGCG